ncbi:hypothetical protein G7Y89_g14958 [Cudoniella acicularis]|uniref:Ankyrin n=1 Tax=Cudoniella acicularis TaxID=354080 RepID=A0A8H4VS81_9HELO|nr:hypothetical protein G7Y89_g14958 [Cudoniella acicularis]
MSPSGYRRMVPISMDGVEPDSKDDDGMTPLSWAAAFGQDAIVKLLLETEGLEVDVKARDGRTPLSLAVTFDDKESALKVVEILLATEGVDAESTDAHGRTPLSWAAGARNTAAFVRLLAEDHVSPNSTDNAGQTPPWQTWHQLPSEKSPSRSRARLRAVNHESGLYRSSVLGTGVPPVLGSAIIRLKYLQVAVDDIFSIEQAICRSNTWVGEG